MGIVWVRGPLLLGVPENPTDSFDGNLQKNVFEYRDSKGFRWNPCFFLIRDPVLC